MKNLRLVKIRRTATILSLKIFFTLVLVSQNILAQELLSMKTFGYQLQNLNVSELVSSPYDLLILDYSFDGSDESALKKEQVEEIIAGKNNRLVVSYFSIGEAEDYRYYFKSSWVKLKKKATCKVGLTKSAPSWLDGPNRSFCGNYKTRYWERAWKRILFGTQNGENKSYLDRIIDAGFQGVYLDIIDGYEYWLYDKKGDKRRKTAAKDMALLVEQISKYAREVRGKPNFIVIPQNGAGILGELSDGLKKRYLNAIDGIGAEDTFYFGSLDENNPLKPQNSTIKNLQNFRDAGKAVLSIDYLTDADKVSDFRLRACNQGFIPQVGLRLLDSVATQTLLGCG